MKTLRLIPLVIVLAACSSVEIPMSPYRIDVQQGNALDQEAVDKLKVGMTSAQVRFLLGTPLLVDPFRNNRWDYVYNYRKAGKLTEKKRLALFFESEVLARIDAEGFAPKAVVPEQNKALAVKPEEKPAKAVEMLAEEPKSVKVEPAKVVAVTPPAPAIVIAPPPVVDQTPAPKAAVAQPVVLAAAEAPQPGLEKSDLEKSGLEKSGLAKPVSTERNLNETSIVPPLAASPKRSTEAPRRPAAVSEKPPEPMTLQPETNVAAIVPELVPAFPDAPAKVGTAEGQVMAALNAWVTAWKSRDEEAYLAAYAANFQPPGGLTRSEWEKRRRLLLGLSRNIDLKIDDHAFESVTEDKAQVSFRQFYRSDSFQDAVIKQLKFVRVDNLWLIEDEKVLAPIKAKK